MNIIAGSPPIDRILSLIPDAKPAGPGKWKARCPAHDDRSPSLSIGVGDDGRALVNCHAGCTAAAIVNALGLTLADLMVRDDSYRPTKSTPPKPPKKHFATAKDAVAELERQLGPRSDWWAYLDSQGEPCGMVIRWDAEGGKDIRPVSRNGSGWLIEGMPTPRPLYGLPDLLKTTGRVFVCEGEKAADAVRSIGLTATTSPHGAKSFRQAKWDTLAGRKVVILPDFDTPGHEYAQNVAAILTGLQPPAKVKIVNLADLFFDMPPAGDAVEFISARRAADKTEDEIRAELEKAADAADAIKPPPSPPGEPDAKTTPAFPDPVPFSQLVAVDNSASRLWEKYIHAGCITLLSSVPKCGKTTLIAHLLQAFEVGADFCDKIVIPARVLIISEESPSQWIDRGTPLGFKDHLEFICRPFVAKPDHYTWRCFINHVAQRVHANDFQLVVADTLGSLWPVRDECDASQVQEALLPLHGITKAGAGVLLTHHLRKSGGDEGMAARGSSALPGFVDAMLELKRLNPSDSKCRQRTLTGFGRWDVPPEVVIEWDHATGQYVALGDKKTTRAAEAKVIIRDLLPRERPGFDIKAVRDNWSDEQAPRQSDLWEVLHQGAGEGLWIKDGSGKRNSRFTFWVEP